MLGRASGGGGLHVLAIECGESDVFLARDGHVDGGGWVGDSGRGSNYSDDFGDDGWSAFGQDADVRVDGDGGSARLHVDRYGECVCGSAGRTECQLYVFGESGGGRVV